jgi:uncharacterized protein involved in exopolysaccharide biosynthesis
VSFKEQLYSELQSQLTQTRLDLQRQQPVVTMVEEPVPPSNRSAPKRTLTVLLGLLVGGFLGMGTAFVKALFDNAEENTEERKKLHEIRERLIPPRWWGKSAT